MDPELVPSKDGFDGSCFDGFYFENVERIQESLFRLFRKKHKNLSTLRFLETQISMDPELVPSKDGFDGSCLTDSFLRMLRESKNPYLGKNT